MGLVRNNSSDVPNNGGGVNWQDIINNRNVGNYGQSGGGQAANYHDLYNRVKEINQGGMFSDKEDRKANIFDYIAKASRESSEAIRDFRGINTTFAQEEDPVKKFFDFLPTIGLGMLGNMGEFAASSYEGLSGRDLSTLNTETGQISSTDLTPEQRGASLVNAVIEGPMAAVGGSGRVLGAAAKGIGKVNSGAGRVIDKILPAEGTGIIRKASEEAGEAMPLAIGKQIGFDVLEEGGEEFVQSIAEDIRDKDHETGGQVNLGKALESFGWGALGGGLMSSGGQLATHFINKGNNSINSNVPQGTQGSNGTQPTGSISPMQGFDLPKEHAPVDDTLIAPAKEYRSEKMFKDGEEQTGGMGAVVVTGKRGQGTNDFEYGLEDFKSMWNSQGKEAHEEWASRYGVTEDYIYDKIVLENNIDKATNLLNYLHQKAGGRIKMSKVRYPGTDETSLIALYLTGFHSGSGMKMSTLAAQLANGDVDGDTGFTWKFDKNQGALLPTQIISNADSKPTSLLEYLPNLNSAKGIEKLRDLVSRRLSDAVSKSSKLEDDLVTNLAEARTNGDAAERAASYITQVRRDLKTSINSATGKIYTDEEADFALSDFLSDIFEEAGEVEVMKDIIGTTEKAVASLMGIDDQTLTGNEDNKSYALYDGDVKDLKSVADLINRLGMNISISRVTSDEPLRDNQGIKYMMKHRETINKTIDDSFNAFGADRIRRLLANILRLENVGEDVQNTIKDYIALETIQKFMNALNLGTTSENRLGGNIKLKTFQDEFQKAYNDTIKAYNNAAQTDVMFDLIEMKPISFDQSNANEYNRAMNAMFKMLEHEPFDGYVFVGDDSQYSGKSFYEVFMMSTEYGIKNASLSGIGTSTTANAEIENIVKFLNKMVDLKQSESVVISNKVYDNMKKCPRMSKKEALDPLGYRKSSAIMSAFVRGLDPEVMVYAHLQDWRVIMASPYADIILNGSASERCNLMLALTMQYKYREVFSLIEEKNNPKSKMNITDGQIAHAAAMVRDGSRISDIIASQFVETGKSEFLEVLTSLDETYEKKKASYSGINNTTRENAGSLLADCLRTDSSNMGLSLISQRLVKMNQDSVMAEKLDNGHWNQHKDDFIKAVQETTDQNIGSDYMDVVVDWLVDESTGYNIQFWQEFFADSLTLSLKNAEKGTTPFSPMAISQIMEQRKKGGMYSYIDNVMMNNNGVMEAENFTTNRLALIDVLFFGKTVTVHKANGYKRVDAQVFCDEVIGQGAVKVENGRVSWNQFKQLIDKAPTLLSNLMPEVATVGPSSKQSVVFAHADSPKDAFVEYRSRTKGSAEKKQITAEREKIRWKLANDISFYMALPGIMDLSDPSRGAIKEQVEKASNIYIDNLMRDAKKLRQSMSNMTEKDRASLVDHERSRLKAKIYQYQMDDMRTQISNALQISDAIATKDPSQSINIASQLTDPLNAAAILVDNWSYQIIDDAILHSTLDNEAKNKIKNFASNLQSDIDANIYSNLVGGRRTAERISIDMVSAMGTDAWKSYTAEKYYEAALFELSKTQEFQITNEIDAVLKELANTITDAVYEQIITSQKLTKENEHVFDFECYDEEKLIAYPEDMKRKAEKILTEYYNPDNESIDVIKKEIDDLSAIINNKNNSIDERRSALKELESQRLYIVNASLSSCLKDLGSFGSESPNFNAYYDADLFFNNYWDAVEDIAFSKDDNGKHKYNLAKVDEKENIEELKPRYGNVRNSFMATTATYHICCGKIGYSVGCNGAIQNISSGLAAVPHTMECGDEGRKVKVGDIISQNLDNSGHTIDIEINGKTERRKLNSTFDITKFPPDLEVTVYDGVCRNPFCHLHSDTIGAPGFEDSIDTLYTYSKILDTSQEAANLKLKKSLRKLKYLATDRDSYPELSPKKFKPSNQASREDVGRQAYEAIIEFRNEVKEYLCPKLDSDLEGAFNHDLGGNFIPISQEEAARAAKVCAYTAEIVYTDSNGVKKTSIITLEDIIVDRDKFIIPDSIDYTSIDSITPFYTPYQVLNKKIIGDVGNDRFNPDPSKKRKVDTQIMKTTIERSVMDWSSYEADSINLGDVIKATPAKRFAFPTQIIPMDSPSAKQRLLSELGYEDNSLSTMINNGIKNLNIDENKSLVTASDRLTEDWDTSNAVITKVRFAKGFIDKNHANRRHYNDLIKYRDQHLQGKGMDEDFSISDRDSAYMFIGEKKDIDDLFGNPKSSAFKYNYIITNERASDQKLDRVINIKGRRFFVYKTQWTRDKAWAKDTTFEYPLIETSVEDYCAAYFDDALHGHLGLPDSGGIGTKEFFEHHFRKIQDKDYKTTIQWDRPFQFDSETNTEVVNLTEYSDILDSLNSKDHKYELHVNGYKGSINSHSVEKSSIKFLEMAIRNHRVMDSSNKWRGGVVPIGQVFSFIKRKDVTGVTHIYPVIFTGKQAKFVSSVHGIDVSGSNVIINKHSIVEIGEDDSVKGFIDWEAYKGMISFVGKDRIDKLPVLKGIDQSFNKYIYYDGLSREKRLSTKGLMVWCLNCWGYSRVRKTSLRANNNQKKKLSKWAEDPVDGKRRIDWLFDDKGVNHPLWKDIADGKETLFIDIPVNKLLNKAIQKLAHSSVYGNQFPLSILFESHEYDHVNKTWGKFKPRDCDEIFGFFNILNFNEMKAIFNAMDPHITSDPMNRAVNRDNPGTLVRDDGMMRWVFAEENGEQIVDYAPGRILRPNLTDEPTNVGQGLGSAVMGKQIVNKIGLLHGMREEDEQNFLDSIMALAGEDVQWDKTTVKKIRDNVVKDMNLHPGATTGFSIDTVNGKWGNLKSRGRRLDAVYANESNYTRTGMNVVRKVEGKYENVNLLTDEEFTSIKSTFMQAFEISDLTDLEFLNEIKKCTGWSDQLGKGEQNVDIKFIEDAVIEMTGRLKSNNNQFYIRGGLYGDNIDRVSVPLGAKGVDVNFFYKSKALQRKYESRGGIKGFIEDGKRELEVSIKAIEELKYVDGSTLGLKQEEKKRAVMNMIMYSQLTHGMPLDVNQLYVGGFTVQDLFDIDDKMQRAFMTDDEIKALERTKELIDQNKEHWKKLERKARDKKQIRIDNSNALAGFSTLVKGSDSTITAKILERAENGIRLCAVANPLLIVPNSLEAFGHSLIAKVGMGLPIGPYSQKNILPDGLVSKVAKNESAFKLYKILNLAQLMNVNDELIMGLDDAGSDIDEFIDSVYAGRGPLGKVSDFVFRLTSGADITERWQFEIFLERMGQYVVSNDIASETMILEDDNGRPVSAMELNLLNNPTGWMINCMMKDSPARKEFFRSLNFAQGAAMSRDTCVSILLDEVFKNHKALSFFNTCFGSTFYRYASNFTGRILNWVMPISSMNYVLVEKLQGIPSLEHLGLERAQIHTDLKSAVIADAMHLSIPTLAILLATGLGAALQPPEDEDKGNDYREYTFFGMRIAEEWWISDILGPALPMACFWKSMIDNKPRLDVLIEGMGTVLSNNPLLKIGDVVELITNQDALWNDLNDEKENFKSAFGGAPTTIEQWAARGSSYFLTCFGRMITPSIIREWQNNTLKYEKSYKKIYAKDVTGVNAEEGQIGDTVNTTYEDAMLRKVTRNNPMLGFIFDLMLRPSTSYVAGGSWIQGMPNVVIEDAYQRESMKQYSIYQVDENGEYVKGKDGKYVEKSDAEKDKVAFNVIATLESTDDMSKLYKQGFMIDAQTRAYVSDLIWEIVKAKQDQFNEIANSEEFSAYALGNGDYWAGREIRSEMFQAYYDDINYLKYTLYRDKLWSYDMRKGVQKYIRENVTYRQDTKGNWYASGTPKTDLNVTGFAFSPGTTDSLFTSAEKEGTMGWEGDWATPSAVTGESLYDRSLIEIKAEAEEVPDFDSWGQNKENGNNKNNNNNSTTDTTSGDSSKPTVTNNPYDIAVMNGGGGGRSGGGRSGGGGGGGGGSAPNLYSRLPNLNISSPRQSSSGNLRDPNFDYLRPNFETKGSREASKRGDF